MLLAALNGVWLIAAVRVAKAKSIYIDYDDNLKGVMSNLIF